MQHSKILAGLAALVVSGAAAMLLAGGASAAAWHDYQGDLFAGHAYGLQVPADARSVEVSLVGEPNATASFAVYSPDGAKLGLYELTSGLATMSVANPAAGRYVVYVYELAEGALKIRVDAPAAPPLDLQAIPLVREDVRIGEFPSGRLDQVVTTQLKAAPVFLTLLYEGSAKELDATVASAKGAVVTVSGESATAFSPGVWTSMKGERAFDAANLEGTVYTVTARAERFEGTMVLTTLALDLATPPVAPPAPPTNATPPVATPWTSPGPEALALGEGRAVAFDAQPGKLLLADPALVAAANSTQHEGLGYGRVTVYDPEDRVVGVVELSHDEPAAELELPVAGEYVAYVALAQDGVVLAKLPGQALPALRNLQLGNETVEIDVDALLSGEAQTFTLARAPVALDLAARDATLSAAATIAVVNETGERLAWTSVLAGAVGFAPQFASESNPAAFRSGELLLETSGVHLGTVVVTSVHYLRALEAPVAVEPAAEPETERPGFPVPGEGLDVEKLLLGLGL